jgi:hypothetical protein
MLSAIEQIVSASVRLGNRSALEQLRNHRQGLLDVLNGVQADSEFDSSGAPRSMAEDLVAINAEVERLDAPGEG